MWQIQLCYGPTTIRAYVLAMGVKYKRKRGKPSFLGKTSFTTLFYRWMNALDIAKACACPICKDKPKQLVCDGTAITLRERLLHAKRSPLTHVPKTHPSRAANVNPIGRGHHDRNTRCFLPLERDQKTARLLAGSIRARGVLPKDRLTPGTTNDHITPLALASLGNVYPQGAQEFIDFIAGHRLDPQGKILNRVKATGSLKRSNRKLYYALCVLYSLASYSATNSLVSPALAEVILASTAANFWIKLAAANIRGKQPRDLMGLMETHTQNQTIETVVWNLVSQVARMTRANEVNLPAVPKFLPSDVQTTRAQRGVQHFTGGGCRSLMGV
jgi:hypothetical protein